MPRVSYKPESAFLTRQALAWEIKEQRKKRSFISAGDREGHRLSEKETLNSSCLRLHLSTHACKKAA